MLKKWLHKMLPAKQEKKALGKTLIPYNQHRIDADMLSFAAEKVLKRLHEAGFEAYVVGGAVRDLLLGMEPKDFDVATNATPEQVNRLFRRSRIIGRRFQIVHVMVGSETIEVTTFRGSGNAVQNAHGRIMKDNTYGSMEEDALRRDFTCNALYYDPRTEEISDFHNGMQDIKERKLVIIGNAAERYQEDPVRILRAVRLSAKLGFDVDVQTALPIAEYSCRLKYEPVARLFDEILKLLFSGNALNCLYRLRELEVETGIHPLLDALIETENTKQNIVSLALQNTDKRLGEEKSVSVGFVLAAVLWSKLSEHWQQNMQNGHKPIPALNEAVYFLRETIEKGWGVPQRFSATMREIWQLQPQFENRKGARPYKLLAQARFRAAYDFLMLRAAAGEVSDELAQWWTSFQNADTEERTRMIESVRHTQEQETSRPKRKRRRKTAKSGKDTAAKV